MPFLIFQLWCVLFSPYHVNVILYVLHLAHYTWSSYRAFWDAAWFEFELVASSSRTTFQQTQNILAITMHTRYYRTDVVYISASHRLCKDITHAYILYIHTCVRISVIIE